MIERRAVPKAIAHFSVRRVGSVDKRAFVHDHVRIRPPWGR